MSVGSFCKARDGGGVREACIVVQCIHRNGDE